MDDVPLPKLELSLLDRFALTGPEGPVNLPSKKLVGLLAYLACNRAHPASAREAGDPAVGSHFEAQTRQNLRQALLRMRRMVGPDALIGRRTRTMAITPDANVARWITTAALGHLGRLDAARAEIDEILALHPRATRAGARDASFRHAWMYELYLGGLRKAGLPEN